MQRNKRNEKRPQTRKKNKCVKIKRNRTARQTSERKGNVFIFETGKGNGRLDKDKKICKTTKYAEKRQGK